MRVLRLKVFFCIKISKIEKNVCFYFNSDIKNTQRMLGIMTEFSNFYALLFQKIVFILKLLKTFSVFIFLFFIYFNWFFYFIWRLLDKKIVFSRTVPLNIFRFIL